MIQFHLDHNCLKIESKILKTEKGASNILTRILLYTGSLSSHVIFALFDLQMVSPLLEFPQA